MNGLRCTRMLIAVAMGLLATAAFGWGGDGHRITAAVAAERLTPEAAAAEEALLDGGSMADASTWADEIRDNPNYAHTRRWHYVNLPRNGPSTYDKGRDCRDNDCVVEQTILHSRQLADRSASTAERAEALRWVIHLVGDVHCPIHVSYADDRGGNTVRLTFNGEATNLHRLWDGGLIYANMPRSERGRSRGWPAYTARLLKQFTDRQAEQWAIETDPAAWANESFQITRTSVYTFPASRELGEVYFRANISHVDDRLAMGGVRLAALLNRIFADGEVPKPEEPAMQDASGSTPPQPPSPGADKPVSIVFGAPCGQADGHEVFIVNATDDTYRVRIRRSWIDHRGAQQSDRTLTLPGGDRGRRRLGCNATLVRGEARTFTWQIVESTKVQ